MGELENHQTFKLIINWFRQKSTMDTKTSRWNFYEKQDIHIVSMYFSHYLFYYKGEKTVTLGTCKPLFGPKD